MSLIAAIATATIALLSATSVVAQAPVSGECEARFQSVVKNSKATGLSGANSQAQAFQAYFECMGAPPDEALVRARIQVELNQATAELLKGTLSQWAYVSLQKDRERKLHQLRHRAGYATAILKGDADGDFVPDSEDRCPDTRRLAATDASGCTLPCKPSADAARRGDRNCQPMDGNSKEDRDFRQLLETTIPINFACEGAERPPTPTLIGVGERVASKETVRTDMRNGASVEVTNRIGKQGRYFTIQRATNQPPDCEVFYEVQFQLREPSNVASPPERFVTVLFAGGEDEEKMPASATSRFVIYRTMTTSVVFGNGGNSTMTFLNLSPARAELVESLPAYRKIWWRVRAVNGGQKFSPWTAFVPMRSGALIETKLD